MRIFVKVKPRAKKDYIECLDETRFIICVKEPPVDGRANRTVVQALAEYFHVPMGKVRIIRGTASREKVIEVDGAVVGG